MAHQGHGEDFCGCIFAVLLYGAIFVLVLAVVGFIEHVFILSFLCFFLLTFTW